MISRQLSFPIIFNLLIQTLGTLASDCPCDTTHGFVKLAGSETQRQFDLWLDYNEKVDGIELTFRRHYFDIGFPYQIGMWFYKDCKLIFQNLI